MPSAGVLGGRGSDAGAGAGERAGDAAVHRQRRGRAHRLRAGGGRRSPARSSPTARPDGVIPGLPPDRLLYTANHPPLYYALVGPGVKALAELGPPVRRAAPGPGRERPAVCAGGAGRRLPDGPAGPRPAARAGDRSGRGRARPRLRLRGRVRVQRRPRAGRCGGADRHRSRGTSGWRQPPAPRAGGRARRRRRAGPGLGAARGAGRRGAVRAPAAAGATVSCRCSPPRSPQAGSTSATSSRYGDPTGGGYLLDLLDRPRRSSWWASPSIPGSGRRSRRTPGAGSPRCRDRSSRCSPRPPSACLAWQVRRTPTVPWLVLPATRSWWRWPWCGSTPPAAARTGATCTRCCSSPAPAVGASAARPRVAPPIGVVLLVVACVHPSARRAGALRPRARPGVRRPRGDGAAPGRRAGARRWCSHCWPSRWPPAPRSPCASCSRARRGPS